MPLIYDPDYQTELDKVKEIAARGQRQTWWFTLIASLIVLVIGIALLDYLIDSDRLFIGSVIGLAAICVIVNIASEVGMMATIMQIHVVATEWGLRKLLGEYEPPTE